LLKSGVPFASFGQSPDNELAVTVAITESYPAIGLILGVAVNREKVAKHQYLGATIAVGASFAMGLFLR